MPNYEGLITLLVLAVAIILALFLSERKENKELRQLYELFQGLAGLEQVVAVLNKELTRRGFEVRDFLYLNRPRWGLRGDKVFVPGYRHSAPVVALFRGISTTLRRSVPLDQEIAKVLGKDTAFIPLKMDDVTPCWSHKKCTYEKCCCHGETDRTCWLESGLTHCGEELLSHEAKEKKCLACDCFTPVGVVAVRKRNGIKKMTRLIGKLDKIIRTAVSYTSQEYKASRDVTGVLNKPTLLEQAHLTFEQAKRYNHSISFAMFDIDHFKRFNDSYGHSAGDDLLKELATLVNSHVRQSDVVGRYGGEEFTIIFTETDKSTAREKCEKIRALVQDYDFLGEKKITISMGVAAFPEDGPSDHLELIKLADLALYHAKSTRNRAVAYSSAYKEMPVKKS